MKIECACGHLIIDQTDSLNNKSYLISDRECFTFWDAIDEVVEKSGSTPAQKEATTMQLRKLNFLK